MAMTGAQGEPASTRRRGRWSAGIGLLLLAMGVGAQVPEAVSGFPTGLSCTPGQLLHRQVGLDRITVIAHHNGRIYSANVGGSARREWTFSNLGDPGSLSFVPIDSSPPLTDHGTHGYTKSGDYLGGKYGLYYRRVAPGVNNNSEQNPAGERFWQMQPEPEDAEMQRVYWPWAAPFNWIQYGPNSGRARLWRADQLLAEWEPLADHGVAGNSILLGNLLFIVSDASMLGIAAYDISPVFNDPPEPPALLDKFTGPVGAYIGAVWENYLVLTGGDDRDMMFVIDYSDPTNLTLVATLDLAGNPALNAGSNVPYMQKQDEYVFTRRHKINMETLAPVLELDEVGNNRPAGSVAGPLDVSQFTLPLGNLLLSGSYSASGRDGIGVWCHQATPDTRAPYVGYHVPRPGQTGFPLGAPVSLVIAEALESYTIVNGQSIILRPVGGTAVDAWTSTSSDGILTLTPRQYLQPDTTYELLIPAGGIKDVAGNGIEAYSFTFSTGDDVDGGNAAPQINAFTVSAAPAEPGQTVQFSASADDPEGDPLQYRFSFGDGSPTTAWSASASVNRSFSSAGHYPVKVQVRDVKPGGGHSVVTRTLTLAVAAAPAGPLPTHSSQLALHEAGRRLWTVDPDNDLLVRVNADSRVVEQRIHLPQVLGLDGPGKPVGVAVTPAGEVWVALSDADRIAVFSPSGTLLANIDTGYGSAPQQLAVSREGSRVFASLHARGADDAGNGQLLRFDAGTRAETGRLELGPSARAIAISGDGARVFVSRFISREHFGEVWEVNGNAMTLTRSIELWRDRGVCGADTGGSDGPGVPNYIASLILSPQQDWLWYGAIKADTNRGLFFRQTHDFNTAMTPDSTVRSTFGRIDLNLAGGPQEPGRDRCGNDRARIDIDNSDSPSALAFAPRGNYVFVALQGNDTVAAFDDLAIRAGGGRSSAWRVPVGEAPQALLYDAGSGVLWSRNFLGRSLTAIAMTDFVAVGSRELDAQTISTADSELLPADVLLGKRLFYFAGDAPDGQNEMSFEGYISCASCHIDGRHDGRDWDFTQRGEGLRNTTDLRGRSGMLHGNVHWTANFDEIEDFVLDIVNEFGGRGFLAPGETPHPSLGAPNHGRSAELDALADYVTSLGRDSLPKSPYRQADGALSAQATAGAAVFSSLGCAGCHRPGNDFTDSTLGPATLHNVGTLRDSSGQRMGGPLPGIDTPSLLGVWDSAPYFHDGSAPTLAAVFEVAGGRMHEAEDGTLAGGASLPGFPGINEDSSFHGHMVYLGENGARVTFDGVQGDAGGIGAVELRYWPASPTVVRLTVNGSHVQERSLPAQRTHFEWTRVRFEDVPLNPGTGNVIEVRRVSSASWRSPGLDNITVSTAAQLAQAAAHRVARDAEPAEFAALLAYLRSLDGSNATDILFSDGFEGGGP